MRIQPHYKFTVSTDPDIPHQIASLVDMETSVPGTLVYGITGNN